uniref:Uncharacterized protein n=1 Tax=Populus alba TaxID=43335 RepID=A0A4U5QT63_POPAL|nr:hypothetical protein D5086_0000060990 [Populus alba]
MLGGNFIGEEDEKEGEGEGEREATLCGGDVCPAVTTMVADGEWRALLGRWKLVLLPLQLVLRTMTEGGYCRGDEEAMRWCPYFNLYLPLLFSSLTEQKWSRDLTSVFHISNFGLSFILFPPIWFGRLSWQ